MLSPTVILLAIFLLGACSVGGLLFAIFYPRLAGPSALDRRLCLISPGAHAGATLAGSVENSRKRSVQETLLNAESGQRDVHRGRAKPALMIRLRQAELGWSKATYYLVCSVTALLFFLSSFAALGLALVPSIGFGLAGGVLVPRFYVSARRKRRFKRFTAEFPNAVDVIVRGIKSGLPLVDCLKIIAAEAQEPVKSEFKSLIEDQTLGMPVEEAVQRLAERVPISEASFFAIVIAIQSRTGGSLSEALGNLSKVLRERKKMQAKIKAMSAEAKASGGIIGVLPVLVAGAVYLTTPKYMSLLFTTSTGNLVLAGCAVWMAIGILVMRKMINFDF